MIVTKNGLWEGFEDGSKSWHGKKGFNNIEFIPSPGIMGQIESANTHTYENLTEERLREVVDSVFNNEAIESRIGEIREAREARVAYAELLRERTEIAINSSETGIEYINPITRIPPILFGTGGEFPDFSIEEFFSTPEDIAVEFDTIVFPNVVPNITLREIKYQELQNGKITLLDYLDFISQEEESSTSYRFTTLDVSNDANTITNTNTEENV